MSGIAFQPTRQLKAGRSLNVPPRAVAGYFHVERQLFIAVTGR